MNKQKYFQIGLGAFIFMLCACDTYIEPHLSKNRIQVKEEKYAREFWAMDLNDAVLEGEARRYLKHGDGPLEISVFYDARSKDNTAMDASVLAADVSDRLQKGGVQSVRANIVPIKGLGAQAKIYLSYLSYHAKAPEDCEVMSGLNSPSVEINPDYKFGCSIDTVFARQIARPKDLMGQNKSGVDGDGRRATNVVEGYRSGEQNKALGGETASE